jgi:hypothetical protein
MNTTVRLLVTLGFMVCVGGAHAQAAPARTTGAQAPANSAPKVEKDCVNLSPQAKQECLKVAKKMDHDAATGVTHDTGTYSDSGNSPSPNTVQHSSPAMETPYEVKQEAKERKRAEAAAAKAKANQASKPGPDTKPNPER